MLSANLEAFRVLSFCDDELDAGPGGAEVLPVKSGGDSIRPRAAGQSGSGACSKFLKRTSGLSGRGNGVPRVGVRDFVECETKAEAHGG